jgi:lipoyl(octanoyl) transferase
VTRKRTPNSSLFFLTFSFFFLTSSFMSILVERRSLACRCFFHPPGDGAWNMAVDEVLMEVVAADGVAALRFYEWSEPTLSLGYFQAAADRRLHSPSLACPLVRRSSGGGAILHDRELTYSLAIPTGHPWAANAERLYIATHEALAAALKSLGVAASPRGEASHAGNSEANRETPPPLLCFQRRAVGDLLIGETKIAGSAQRRRRGAVLQHGSILLAASHFAPELPGIEDLTSHSVEANLLAGLFQTALASRLNMKWEDTADWKVIAGRSGILAREKFASAAWTFRR